MKGLRILVVEDNALNLRLIRDLLELNGHEVVEAINVDEGRIELERAAPDGVLLDIGIPGGGGETLLREIRRHPKLAALPVIAVTAFAMQGDRERLLNAGFNAYVSKPINTYTFVRDIEIVLKTKPQ